MSNSFFWKDDSNHSNIESSIFDKIQNDFIKNGDLAYAGELLKIAYEKYPNNIALIHQNQSLTYKEFYFRSILFSRKLKASGIKPRDKVLIFSENSIAFYIAYFAVWQIGAIAVPVNIFLHAKELSYIIKDSEPVAIICSSLLKSNIEDLVTQNYLDNLPAIFTNQDIDFVSPIPGDKSSPDKSTSDTELLSSFEVERLETDELCLLLYTSGTTGTPKGVMLSSRNIMTNAIQAYSRFNMMGLTDKERFFCVLPLFHVFAQNACLWLPLITGSTIIIVQKIDRKLILEGLKHQPTLFLGFPALYGLLCMMKTAPLDSVKVFVSGADMLPDKIRQAFGMVYGRKICAGYGLSEASPIVAVNYCNNSMPTHFVGRPLAGIECDIRDDDGKSLPHGTIGHLWIRGGNIMIGYYKSSAATAKVMDGNWLNTGDLGLVDSRRYLAISGRVKDIIIHKGFNIYPAEIENVLLRHPDVFKAAVVGQEDSDSGQIPVAFVAIKSKNNGIEASLRSLCTNNLAAYKVPRKFVCVEDLPMNSTGKVDKKQLRI
ncbi:MAG: Long-chain-fatty-acid-CoA ligase [candidate division TM6 bacterium GW2011_GWF2_36_6]|jgi:long-chain acyl-CoA synthetase|nr:MAG: Long-chain-fatty-acid-CoA ligase [candidate division TM6 bacterium GW2011_GWF2_36_6]